MEKITIAELLPSYEAYQHDNVNPVYKAQVHTDSEGEISAFVKSIPDHELLMECVCALLGRSFGLPIPKPLLVVTDPETCPPNHDVSKPLFGCEELQHPSVRRFVCPYGDKDPHLFSFFIAKLKQWKHLHGAALFDEHMANGDRHGGNYLFDGKEFYLIDHGLAFKDLFNGKMSAEMPLNDNSFFSFLAEQDDLSRRRSLNKLKKLLAEFGLLNIDEIYNASLHEAYSDNKALGEKMVDIYLKRIEHITEIVLNQLGFSDPYANINEYGSW